MLNLNIIFTQLLGLCLLMKLLVIFLNQPDKFRSCTTWEMDYNYCFVKQFCLFIYLGGEKEIVETSVINTWAAQPRSYRLVPATVTPTYMAPLSFSSSRSSIHTRKHYLTFQFKRMNVYLGAFFSLGLVFIHLKTLTYMCHTYVKVKAPDFTLCCWVHQRW